MNIVILFTGEARTFPFALNKTKYNMDVLDSYNKYFFTDKFKSLCNYKIYISTDNIDIEDTINYFSRNNIGNIHMMDTNYYLNPIKEITDVQKYITEYDKQDFSNVLKFTRSIEQHYKILDCYNLFKNDNPFTKVDYVIRIRPDCIICQDIIEAILLLNDNPELEIVIKWDFFAIGKPKIMEECYCNGLNINYGHYTYKTIIPDILPVMNDYKYRDHYHWLYAPERQLFEMLFEYCNNNGLDINKTIYEMKEFCHILRDNGAITY